jgi:ribonuclease HI
MKIYIDGSSLGNPGPGGYGIVVVDTLKNMKLMSGPSKGEVTNNRMELEAFIRALVFIRTNPVHNATIFSDSRYVVDGFNLYLSNWYDKQGNLKKADLKNEDMWNAVRILKNQVKFKVKWIKGHNGNKFNQIADDLAQKSAKKAQKALDKGSKS